MMILPAGLLLAAALSSPQAQAMPEQSGLAAKPPAPALSSETRGDIFMAKKNFREAVEMYQEGAAGNAVLQNKLGIAYQQLNQPDNALKAYARAVKLKPDYMEALNNIGTVYYARKSYRRAISAYNRALKTVPGEPRGAVVYENMGRAWFNRKDYEKARECLQTALRLDPEVFQHHGDVGQILEETSIEERARYHFYLAKIYATAGRNDLALQYLRKALEEGFKGKKTLDAEPDFATLKALPEFKELLAREPRVL
jgi:tetratricopeptide (TPR) repeat protein